LNRMNPVEYYYLKRNPFYTLINNTDLRQK